MHHGQEHGHPQPDGEQGEEGHGIGGPGHEAGRAQEGRQEGGDQDRFLFEALDEHPRGNRHHAMHPTRRCGILFEISDTSAKATGSKSNSLTKAHRLSVGSFPVVSRYSVVFRSCAVS